MKSFDALVVSSGDHVCALPLAVVRETMRPLPTRELPGAPPGVSGIAIVRAEPVPVVDLGALLGETRTIGRFVTLAPERGTLAIAVEAVLGIRRLDHAQSHELPPLLGAVARDLVETLEMHDDGLVHVLRPARMCPPGTWEAVEAARGET